MLPGLCGHKGSTMLLLLLLFLPLLVLVLVLLLLVQGLPSTQHQ